MVRKLSDNSAQMQKCSPDPSLSHPDDGAYRDEETGEVTVELVGACVACPASDQTLKAGIERILRDRVDGVTTVRNVGETANPDGPIGATGPDEGTAVSL